MKILFCTFILVFIASCTQSQSIEKETVTAFLETNKGVRHNLNLEFKEFSLSTLTVADSIKILETKFQKEQSKKLNSLDKQIASYKKRIEERKRTNNDVDQVVESSLQKRFKYDLEKLKKKKEETEKWRPNYLDTYSEKIDINEPLVKKVNAIFLAQKLSDKAPAEYRGTFILTLDGKKCYKMIPYPKEIK